MSSYEVVMNIYLIVTLGRCWLLRNSFHQRLNRLTFRHHRGIIHNYVYMTDTFIQLKFCFNFCWCVYLSTDMLCIQFKGKADQPYRRDEKQNPNSLSKSYTVERNRKSSKSRIHHRINMHHRSDNAYIDEDYCEITAKLSNLFWVKLLLKYT